MKLVLLALVALAWGDMISVNPDLTTFSLTQTTGDFRAVRILVDCKLFASKGAFS